MRSKIATKLVVLLLLASLLPLLAFALLSLWQLKRTTEISVTQGNVNVARRAGSEIEQYVKNGLAILESTAENINHADLKDWQKERILKNYINRFNEFNELTIWDQEGRLVATSRLDAVSLDDRTRPALERALGGQPYLSSVFIKEDLSPAMVAAYPIRRMTEPVGALVAEIDLLQMWRLVDSIRIGKNGILNVIGPEGNLIATGDGGRKKEVFQQRPYEPSGRIQESLRSQGSVFRNPDGVKVLAVGTQLSKPLEWTVLVEEPTLEAYALARRISYLLAAIMGGIIVVALFLGYDAGNRRVVKPIHSLIQATDEISKGNLDYRVELHTGDELTVLGDAFNQMSLRLKELQEKLIREERHALFGRIASGLAHDLKHPIQAIETSSRLMDKMHDDPEFRNLFRKTVDREFTKINIFLQNLHNLTHEIPHHPLPLKISEVLHEALATFEPEAKKQGIEVTEQLSNGALVRGDELSLNRAFSNLISNALQAMSGGGRLALSVSEEEGQVEVQIKDTGMGIPPERLKTLFDDFVTTKRHGLGLGLAITRKIIHQHRGSVRVASRVGEGTTFFIRFPVLETQS